MTTRFRLRHAAVLGLATSVLAVSPALAKPGNAKSKADVVVTDGAELRDAIDAANAASGPYVISLKPGTYVLDAPGAQEDANESGDLDVTGNAVVLGNGSTIDLDGYGDRAFDVLAGGSLSIDQLTIANGAVTGAGASGGAIQTAGTLTVDRSNLLDNDAVRAGGAIEGVTGSTTSIDRTSLAGNFAGNGPGNGGAVHMTGTADLSVARSSVVDNVAAREGGGLWIDAGGVMTVTSTYFSGNVAQGTAADDGGGALFNNAGTLVVDRSSIEGNSAPMGSGSGGGIFNLNGSLTVSKTTISGNDAARAGGGIETVNGTTTISQSALTDNVTGAAPGNGGGLHASGTAAIVTIDRTDVTGNTAALEGGGLWAGAGDSVMTVTRSNISGNTANGAAAITGGGGLFNKGGLLVVEQSTISGNHADIGSGSGGGILNLGTLEVDRTEISGNSSARAGGGIESNDVNGAGDATLTRVELIDNTTGPTPGNGGGMHVTGSSITTLIDDSVVTGNDAVNEGGGLWNFAGATMTVTDTVIVDNTSPIAPNVFQNGAGGNFTVDGVLIAPGDNMLAFP